MKDPNRICHLCAKRDYNPKGSHDGHIDIWTCADCERGMILRQVEVRRRVRDQIRAKKKSPAPT